jgi:HlyD family type I secretion membrane fusion protein
VKKFELSDVIFYVVGLLFIAFIVWANYAEIDQVVRAEAKVEPAMKVQRIQSRYSGSVQSIYVEVGDTVKQNQVILSLDKSEGQISLNTTKSQIELIEEELAVFEPLVELGIEPKIKLIEIKQRLIIAKEKLARAELQVNNSDVKSSITGTVSAVYITGRGAVIKSGETLIEVIPKADYFIVKAKILPKDISKVNVGQLSRVSFSAYDFSRYGVLIGKVTKIAQNTTQTQQGEIYYDAWILTEGDKLSKSDIVLNIMPGMIATVDLLGGKLTVLEYILSPLQKGAAKAFTEL